MKLLLLTLILLICGTVDAATPPKVYTVKISQDSGAPYLVSEMENTLGTVGYSRIEEGRFRITCSGCS